MKKNIFLITFLVLTSSLLCSDQHFVIEPYLQNVTKTEITISWQDKNKKNSYVRYGVTKALKLQAKSSSKKFDKDIYHHEIRLKNLKPATKYFYQVYSDKLKSKIFYFKAAPPAESSIKFAVYGDNRKIYPKKRINFVDGETSDPHLEIIDKIFIQKPDLILNTGDLVNYGGRKKDWYTFFDAANKSKNLMSFIPYYVVVGNHELYYGFPHFYNKTALKKSVKNFSTLFDLPKNAAEQKFHERYYSFKFGPAYFIVTDFSSDKDPKYSSQRIKSENCPDYHPGSAQYKWLEKELTKAQKESKFTFIFFHLPPYSTGYHGRPNDKNSGYKIRPITEMFHKYKVAAVFNGHDHFYERNRVKKLGKEIDYVVTGGGGAPLYPSLKNNTKWMKGTRTITSKKIFHYVFGEIKKDKTDTFRASFKVFGRSTIEDGGKNGEFKEYDAWVI